jgi:ribosomal protein S18 acetylase RimI-like enzyme
VADEHPIISLAFSLQPITESVIDSVIALHRKNLYYSTNSRLGASHLSYLYQVMQKDVTCLVVAAVSNEEVLGVVSATLDPGKFTRRLFGNLSARRWAAVLFHLVSQPGIWLEWLESHNTSRPVQYQGREIRPCLTTIVVSQAACRRGVGRALVSAVDEFVLRNGGSAYHLDTRADNSGARAFYKKLGFIEVEERGRDVIFVRQL